MGELNAITAIAYRDLMKFVRDPARIVATFIFPLSFQAKLDMTNVDKTAKKFRSYRDVKKADRDFYTKLTAT